MQIIATSDAHVARNRHRDKLVVVVAVVAGFVCFVIVVGGGGSGCSNCYSCCSSSYSSAPLRSGTVSSAVTFCRRYGVRNCKCLCLLLLPLLQLLVLLLQTLPSMLCLVVLGICIIKNILSCQQVSVWCNFCLCSDRASLDLDSTPPKRLNFRVF